MRYEWNQTKRISNIHKHGIDFVDCVEAFEAHGAMTMEDSGDYGERRFLTLGWMRGHLIVVAHTEQSDVIRIISARKATTHEQRIYFQQARD